jgi:hypothetical protein
MPTETSSQPPVVDSAPPTSRSRLIFYYVWLVLKNLIGWALILASGPIGLALPGPGGLPMFIIGFAMITFPGKRALTGRVLRGRPWRMNSRAVIAVEAFASFVLPALVVWVLSIRFKDEMRQRGPAVVWTVYGLSVVLSFFVVRLGMRVVNFAVTFVPMIRRKVRPWMRHHGIDLLPPRRRKRLKRKAGSNVNTSQGQADIEDSDVDTGILELDSRFHDRLWSLWARAKPWVFVAASFAITAAIIYWLATKS